MYPLSFDKFCLVKELYRHKFIRSSHPKHVGSCVLIDNVGSFNESLKAFRRHGVRDDDVIGHAVFLVAYFTSIIDPRPYPHGRIVRVFDLSGFHLLHATNLRAMRLGLRLTMTAEKYFPEVLQSVIVVNAHPFAISVYNRLIRGLLLCISARRARSLTRSIPHSIDPSLDRSLARVLRSPFRQHERTRNKFQFHSDDAVLREMLGCEQLDWQNAESAVEVAMYEYVMRQGRDGGSKGG